jgi:hypothetical protein
LGLVLIFDSPTKAFYHGCQEGYFHARKKLDRYFIDEKSGSPTGS